MNSPKLRLHFVCGAIILWAVAQATAQPFSILQSFGVAGNGPIGTLVRASDGSLYGTTSYGGAGDLGVIFRMNSDGTGATNIFSFSEAAGAYPYGGLTLNGSTLYGTTTGGGTNDYGTVFEIQTDGSGFTSLHAFNDSDGSSPMGTLTLIGSVLYGTTQSGGTSGSGTVFSINTSGSGFATLKNFSETVYNGSTVSTNFDGTSPSDGVIVSGTTLYGTAYEGGPFGYGTVFALSLSGSVFSNLYSFTGLNDGEFPDAGLVISGSTLYGATVEGGTNDYGTVFALQTDGDGFTVLHQFDYDDGEEPYAAMVLSGSTLYGTTFGGGQYGGGTIFQMNTGGSGFTNLVNMDYDSTGSSPYGLTLSGSTLFGINASGGAAGLGTVYTLNTDDAGFTVINNFIEVVGSNPYGGLIAGPNNTLYGTLSAGGADNNGVVFQINQNGSGFSHLYDFTSEGSDGNAPYSKLVTDGTFLYGTTFQGGAPGYGEVFKVNPDGSGLSSIFSFQYGGTDNSGANPIGGLVLSGHTLYGTTSVGGLYDGGTVYSLNTDGTRFTVLHHFQFSSDGSSPQGALVVSGDMLYGTTSDGGSLDYGTVFGLSINGGGFTNLHSFGFADGASPYSDLVASGNMLYGTTEMGGSNDMGEVFALTMNGNGFTNLHNFIGADGSSPYAGLVLSGSTLFGTTSTGGSSGFGTVFAMSTSGSGFTDLYNFTGGDDGGNSFGDLALSGSTLYGTTAFAGADGEGVVFKLQTGGTGFATLYAFDGGSDGANPFGGLLLSNGVLYGTASAGGTGQQGTVFQLSATGGGFATIHSFNSSSDGSTPYGTLVLSGTTLYGTTYRGGSGGYGTIYAVATDGSGLTPLHNFNGGEDGAFPYAGLLLAGGTLFGTTFSGGAADDGAIFKINTDGSGFATLLSFPTTRQNPFTGSYGNTDGASPVGGLVLAGSTLYGTASQGGGFGYGVVFGLDTNGSGFRVLHNFSFADGSGPYGGLTVNGNSLYGITSGGGFYGYGTIFKVNTDGSGFTNLHNFAYSDGGVPEATMVLSGSALFGTTTTGGAQGYGTVFQFNLNGTGFTTLHSFISTDGSTPYGSLALTGNAIYGVTDLGGPGSGGVIFSIGGLTLSMPALQIEGSGVSMTVSWPSPSTGYILQQSGNLLPAGWANFQGVTTDNGTTKSITISPANGNQFFRLQSP